ncbi:MAG: glycosyltransferase family 2 protein [Bdellovibrionaceae bacterium]|jgi:glycosyltransferase involved in cell wall biosynthesis|nr:glycosyltransferase family 2 protein [Pseudobdellovibrionaceae bacterium]
MHLSIVVPVYKARLCLSELHQRLTTHLEKFGQKYEIILVEDGSPDTSWELIQEISGADPRVRGLSLSRNFGQHPAITAGLDYAQGEWIVVMDCDLQDRPEEILKLYEKALEGYDIVLARRIRRQDSMLKKASSYCFYWLLSYVTGTYQDPSIANFGIYCRKAIDVLRTMRESNRYFPVMIRWVGFRVATLDVQHAQREHGETSYNFLTLFRLALNVILSFSDKPLRLVVKIGFSISIISFFAGIYVIFRSLNGSISVLGWPALIVSIWFLSGTIIFVLGLIGLYIGRIFEQIKGRPIYIVREKCGSLVVGGGPG